MPSQEELNSYMYISVKSTTDTLTNEELAVIGRAALLGMDPHHLIGYEKAKPLFTENDGTRMHQETQTALQRIIRERL